MSSPSSGSQNQQTLKNQSKEQTPPPNQQNQAPAPPPKQPTAQVTSTSPASNPPGKALPQLPQLQEPRLQKFSPSEQVQNIIAKSPLSCITASKKYLVVGTITGHIHVFGINAQRPLLTLAAHSMRVTCLSLTVNGDFLASGSEDGKAIVTNLTKPTEKQVFPMTACVNTIAIHPLYHLKDNRKIIIGLSNGQLRLVSRSWVSFRSTVIHEDADAGPVNALSWNGSLVAWANNRSVKIFDLIINQKISQIERKAQNSGNKLQNIHLRSELYPCSLSWKSSDTLFIGWIDYFQIVNIVPRAKTDSPDLPSREGSIQREFYTSFYISDVVPIQNDILALAYYVDEDDEDESPTPNSTQSESETSSTKSSPGEALCPELSLLNYNGESLLDEELSFTNYQHLFPRDLHLCRAPNQDIFYACSPTSLIIMKLIDGPGLANFYFKAERYLHAFNLARLHRQILGPKQKLIDFGFHCVIKLLHRRQSTQAATLLSYLLGGTVIAPLMPPEDCEKLKQLGPPQLEPQQTLWSTKFPMIPFPNFVDGSLDCYDALYPEKHYPTVTLEKIPIDPHITESEAKQHWEKMSLGYFSKQSKCLPALMPYLPIDNPRLSPSVYDQALFDCLASKNLTLLLYYLKLWPIEIFHPLNLITHIRNRLKSDQIKNVEKLWLNLCLCILFFKVKKFSIALEICIHLRKGPIFATFNKHPEVILQVINRISVLLSLFQIDSEKTLNLLVEHHEILPPPNVIRLFSDDQKKKIIHPDLLAQYFHAMFEKDSTLCTQFDLLQFDLYSTFNPDFLLHFIKIAKFDVRDLSRALEICTKKKLYRAQAYILMQQGSFPQALQIFIHHLRDIRGALDFVLETWNHKLWQLMVDLTRQDPVLYSELLDLVVHIPQVDAAQLIRKTPDSIFALKELDFRSKFLRFLSEARQNVQLNRNCLDILNDDTLVYSRHYHKIAREGIFIAVNSKIEQNLTSPVPCSVLGGVFSQKNLVREPISKFNDDTSFVICFNRHLYSVPTQQTVNPNFREVTQKYIEKKLSKPLFNKQTSPN